MAKIKFENGVIVNFDGIPNQKDVDEVANKLGITPQVIETYKRHQEALANPPALPEKKTWAGAAKNVIPSAVNLGKGLIDPRTYIGMGKVAAGGIQSIPGVGEKFKDTKQVKENQQAFQDFIGGLKERYGSVENFTNSAYKDPVGVAFDLSIVAGGVKGLAKKTGVLPKSWEKPITTPKFVGEGLSKVAEATKGKIENIPTALETKNLKLTGVQSTKLGKAKIKEVAQFNLENLKPGTDANSRFDQITNIVNKKEKAYSEGLSGSKKTISKSEVKKALEEYKIEAIKDQVDAPTIEKQIDAHIKNLDKLYKDDIPIENLNNLKRSTYEGAYNKAGDKVLNEIEHGVADVYKTEIEKAGEGITIDGKTIKEFNKEYGLALTSKKLLRLATARPELGLTNKLISSGVGAGVGMTVGGPVGAGIGALVGKEIGSAIGGTRMRSAIGGVIKKGTEMFPKAK